MSAAENMAQATGPAVRAEDPDRLAARFTLHPAATFDMADIAKAFQYAHAAIDPASFKAEATAVQTVTFPAATEAAAEAAADLRATVLDAFETERAKIIAEAEAGRMQPFETVAIPSPTSRDLEVRRGPDRIVARLPYMLAPQTYIREDLAAPQPAPLDPFQLEPALAPVIREAVEAAYGQATADWVRTNDESCQAEARARAAAARADRLARALDILPKTEG